MRRYIKFTVVSLASFFLLLAACSSPETAQVPEAADTAKISFADLYQQEEQVLTAYKILDADKGIYQIPIERAMELLAAESSR